MPKGSTVFAQIMSLISRRQFNNCHARLRPGISSSKKPVFKDDRAKIPFSSSKLVQNEDEKAKTTLSSSKMPQNKDECLVYNCSVAVLRPRAFTVTVTGPSPVRRTMADALPWKAGSVWL